MSLLGVLEGQTGGTAAAVLREEVLRKDKHTVEFKKRRFVQRERERGSDVQTGHWNIDIYIINCRY